MKLFSTEDRSLCGWVCKGCMKDLIMPQWHTLHILQVLAVIQYRSDIGSVWMTAECLHIDSLFISVLLSSDWVVLRDQSNKDKPKKILKFNVQVLSLWRAFSQTQQLCGLFFIAKLIFTFFVKLFIKIVVKVVVFFGHAWLGLINLIYVINFTCKFC